MKGPFHHPLDKLINDDKLFLLETMIPFVDERMKAPLAMYIKVMELQLILRGFRNHSYVNKCGLCRDINNQDDVLDALATCGFGEIAGQMNQFKSMMNIMNMMEENGTGSGHSGPFGHAGYSSGMNKRFQEIFDEFDGNEQYNRDDQYDRLNSHDKYDGYDTYSMYEKYSGTQACNDAKNDNMLDNIMNLLDEYDHSHQ